MLRVPIHRDTGWRGGPVEEDRAKERSTYPCFHTGGTSDARYGASRPALAAPYTPMRRVNCPARYRAARRGTLYARERRIVYTVVPYRWSYCSPRRLPVYAACCISMREAVPPSPSDDVDLSLPFLSFPLSFSVPPRHSLSPEQLLASCPWSFSRRVELRVESKGERLYERVSCAILG